MFINSIMSTVKIPDGHPDVKDFNFTGAVDFTGCVTAPTVDAKTSNRQVATTAFVTNAINELKGGPLEETLNSLNELAGAIGNGTSFSGNAGTATKLATATTIAGKTFDGSAAVTIASGDLSDATTFTAPKATKLATARAINGTDFDGSSPITVTASAGTLTGATLNANVTGSSLTSVGTLANLTVSGALIVNGGSIDTTDQNEEVKLFDSAQKLYVGGKSSNIFIGTDNPVTGSVTTVTIGASNDTVNILGDLTVSGTTTKVNTTDLEVTDKLITLNKGGNAESAPGAGFTIEANGQADAAYIKVHSDSAKFAIKAPNSNAGFIVTKDGNDDFSARNITATLIGSASTVSDGAIITAKIADDAVTYAKIQNVATANRVLGSTTANGTVSEVEVATGMIADDAVTYAKIQNVVTANRVLGSTAAGGIVSEVEVGTDMIAANAVTAAKLAADAVETLKIKDANVTAAKLAADAVETLKIKDANVTAAKLAADAVETSKIKDANVTAAKLAESAVDLASNKVTGMLPINNGGTGATTAAGARTALGLGSTDSPSFAGLTVGGASLSFSTLSVNTTLSTGNYIVGADTKTFTLPATTTAGNLITIYSPSYSYTLANGSTNATIAANAVTVCIATSTSTWVAYASGVLVTFAA